jgi:hypothetical protein
MEIDTTLGSGTNSFELGLEPGTPYNFIVNWGIGDVETITGSTLTGVTKTYSTPGVYEIKIKGTFPFIFMSNSNDKLKLTKIMQWGDIVWANFSMAFIGCSNMNVTATDTPNLSNVILMGQMFEGCSSLNTPSLGSWSLNLSLTDMFFILENTGLSTENYSRTLIGWANYVSANGDLPSGVLFESLPLTYDCINYVSGQTYNNAVDAKDYLENGTPNWDMRDGGQTGAPC